MRKLVVVSMFVLLAWNSPAPAQDEPAVLVEKAIKAHGGAEKLAKMRAMQVKAKGELVLMGTAIPMTSESMFQAPDKYRENVQFEIAGQQIKQAVGFDGKNAWINVNGMDIRVEGKLLDQFKSMARLGAITELTPLKDKAYKLSSLGEAKIQDRPAVGIKVVHEGHQDVSLYFWKDTHLIAKFEYRGYDAMSDTERTEERIVTDYQDIDGAKVMKKVLLLHDAKKAAEIETTEVKFVDKIDDSNFAKP